MPAISGDPSVIIAEDMRALPFAARKAARLRIRRAGEMVAADARARASWSSRIPGTVRVSTSFRFGREGVEVRAGGPNAPHARPYEGLSRDPFRAPLFGNRKYWYPHAARPFLAPSARANEGRATELIRGALAESAAELGFK